MMGSLVIVVRAWQQDHGIVVRILSSEAGRATSGGECVVASIGQACDVVRKLLESLITPATDD
jgi:hypothetical protein